MSIQILKIRNKKSWKPGTELAQRLTISNPGEVEAMEAPVAPVTNRSKTLNGGDPFWDLVESFLFEKVEEVEVEFKM